MKKAKRKSVPHQTCRLRVLRPRRRNGRDGVGMTIQIGFDGDGARQFVAQVMRTMR